MALHLLSCILLQKILNFVACSCIAHNHLTFSMIFSRNAPGAFNKESLFQTATTKPSSSIAATETTLTKGPQRTPQPSIVANKNSTNERKRANEQKLPGGSCNGNGLTKDQGAIDEPQNQRGHGSHVPTSCRSPGDQGGDLCLLKMALG